MMTTERGMVSPAADGTVLASAVPVLAGRIQATAFDANTDRPDVVPSTRAIGTKLRWSAPKLIAAANETVPKTNVRTCTSWRPHP
ncbi:hypothetical protein [Streptomyces sp. NPDC002490]|uniref:hypothetical protein n=1 Tax=Streptomyces sp. NPDC002490 TaxID=3154416 RepID=UPI0033295B9E